MLRRRAAQVAAAALRAALANPHGGAGVQGGPPAAAVAAARTWQQLRHQSQSQWGGRPRQEYVTFQRRGGGGSRGQRGAGGLTRGQVTLLVGTAAGGTLVWASSRQEVPYTGRKHAVLVDPATERQLGEQTFAQVLAEARAARSLLPATHPATRAVRRVGERIAAVAGDGVGGGFQAQMRGLKWEFAVIQSPDCNAFVVPGGKVVVYTGLLALLSTEDELAAVLAHEVAHVVARHAAERITQGSALEVVRAVAYWGFGLPIPAAPLQAVFFLPNSRKAETEADAIGVQLAARACFDPGAAVAVFEKLGRAEAAAGGGAVPALLRTHPVSADRVRAIKQMLPRAHGLGEAAGCGASLDLFHQFEGALQGRQRGGGGAAGVGGGRRIPVEGPGERW